MEFFKPHETALSDLGFLNTVINPLCGRLGFEISHIHPFESLKRQWHETGNLGSSQRSKEYSAKGVSSGQTDSIEQSNKHCPRATTHPLSFIEPLLCCKQCPCFSYQILLATKLFFNSIRENIGPFARSHGSALRSMHPDSHRVCAYRTRKAGRQI